MLPHLEAMLQDPAALDSLRQLGAAAFAQIGFYLEDIQIMRANSPAFDAYDGLFVGEAARRAGHAVPTQLAGQDAITQRGEEGGVERCSLVLRGERGDVRCARAGAMPQSESGGQSTKPADE